MRAFIGAMILTAASVPAAEATVWTAACSGQNEIQYQQVLNGDGYLHLGQSDGTFTTVKLKQTYYDGKMVCGGTGSKAQANQIGAICADNANQTIRVEYGSQLAKGVRPEKAPVYCQAQVSIN
jgi:hypothetical protein